MAGPGQNIWSEQLAVLLAPSACPPCGEPPLFVYSIWSRVGPLGTQNQDKYLPEAYLAPTLAKCLFKMLEWKLPDALGEILWLHLGSGDQVAKRTQCAVDSSWCSKIQGCEPFLQMWSSWWWPWVADIGGVSMALKFLQPSF